MFYILIKHRFLTNQSAQGPIYILIYNKMEYPVSQLCKPVISL